MEGAEDSAYLTPSRRCWASPGVEVVQISADVSSRPLLLTDLQAMQLVGEEKATMSNARQLSEQMLGAPLLSLRAKRRQGHNLLTSRALTRDTHCCDARMISMPRFLQVYLE